jgi:hypothetical protein
MANLQPQFIPDFQGIYEKVVNSTAFEERQAHNEVILSHAEIEQALNLCMNQEDINVELGYNILEGSGFKYKDVLPFIITNLFLYSSRVIEKLVKFYNDFNININSSEVNSKTFCFRVTNNKRIQTTFDTSVYKRLKTNTSEVIVYFNYRLYYTLRGLANNTYRVIHYNCEFITIYYNKEQRNALVPLMGGKEINTNGNSAARIYKAACTACQELNEKVYLDGKN